MTKEKRPFETWKNTKPGRVRRTERREASRRKRAFLEG